MLRAQKRIPKNLRIAATQRKAAAFESPYKAYKLAQQPEPKMSWQDYLDLSKQAADALLNEARSFCDENNFSYIEIPHRIFKDEYEDGPKDLSFREWLDSYCTSNGLNSRADFCIIGPRVKEPASAERKVKNKPAEDNCDFVGIMFTALKKRKSIKNRQSLNNLKKAIAAISVNQRVIDVDVEKNKKEKALKDYFRFPSVERRFRAFKSIWNIMISEDNEWAGLQVAAEIKIEHESLMDIDKITRYFMDVGREMGQAIQKFSEASHHPFVKQGGRNAYMHALKTQNRRDGVDSIAALLYDRVSHDAGLNQFLDSTRRSTHTPLTYREIAATAVQLLGKCCPESTLSNILKRIDQIAGNDNSPPTRIAKDRHFTR